jgi:hypothetical protein
MWQYCAIATCERWVVDVKLQKGESLKVFEEMEELQNKHSEEKNDVPKWSVPDKKLSECKRLSSHLVCEFDLAKLTHRCQLIAEHGRRRVRLIKNN